MPIDSILVAAGVVAIFVTFAGVLMWGDSQSRSARSTAPVGNTKRRSF
jgi:hypothetical protein